VDQVLKLITLGAQVDVQDKEGWMPLVVRCCDGVLQMKSNIQTHCDAAQHLYIEI
jgi:hypothetical protein